MPSICVAVLNYNGVHHLERLLPSLRDAVETWGGPCPVVILDNQSTAGDREWVAREHPWAELAVAPGNDYLFSYNWLLSQRGEDIVIFLNNDMRVDPGFIAPLAAHFRRDDLFAVAACCRNWDGSEIQNGPARLLLHHGWVYTLYETRRQALTYTLFVGGGCGAFDRRKFLALGGFDRLFFPAYGEDLDIGFRAWSRGWTSLYEPRSVLYHRESGTMGETALGHIIRAQFLFQWRNLRPPVMRAQRGIYTAWQRFFLRRGDVVWQSAFHSAVAAWQMGGREALERAPRRVDLWRLKHVLESPVLLEAVRERA